MSTLKYYYYYLDSEFIGYPAIIRITVFLVLLFIFIYFLTLLRIGYISFRLRQGKRREQRVEDKYGDKIFSLLVEDSSASVNTRPTSEDLKEMASLSDWEKIIITQKLLDLRELHAEKFNEDNFRTIVDLVGLNVFWENQLTHSDYGTVKNAVRKLEAIDDKGSGVMVRKVAQRNNSFARKIAKSAYMNLSSMDGLDYLDNDFDRKFNALDELRIHNSLLKRQAEKPLQPLVRWVLNSKNVQFQVFLIKEIAYFDQVDAAEVLLEYFSETYSSEVKAEIARTLGHLKYKDAVQKLQTEYHYVRSTVQLAIVEYMGLIGTRKALEFLVAEQKKVQSSELQIEMIRNIYRIEGAEGMVYKELMQNASSDFNKSIFNFVEKDEQETEYIIATSKE